MRFKKTLCLLAGLFLSFGASSSFAQEADPRGVRVRFVSPDSAAWAGIAKTIKVNVLRTKSLAPTLDTVIVALRADTLAPRNTSSLTTGSFKADTLGLATGRFVDTLTAVNGTGSAVDTFKFTFTVTVGDPEASFVVANAFLSTSANTSSALAKLNNLNTTAISTVSGFTDAVGDKKFVKVDGLRPVNGSIFDSVLVDTAAATTDFAGLTGTRAFKIGSQVKLKMKVQNFSAASAKVGIYETTQVDPDSAMYSKSFDAAAIVTAAGSVRDSFNVTAGQFTIAGLQNNLRTKVVAFLVDNAGNLGATAATSAGAIGFSQNITYVFDSNAPTITLAHPDSTTDRFTGRVDTSLSFVRNDGTNPGDTHTLQPLKFKASEGVLTRWAIVGTDTAAYGQTNTTTDLTFVTSDSFSTSKGQKAGKELDLSVVVLDSVGNKSTKTVTKVIHDQEAPVFSNLFPASTSLPENKINNITRHPIFQISEVADSISVRFVQVGATPRDVATQSVSAAKLTTVGSDISVTVNDTLLNLEKYVFQVFIRDLAKNVNVSTKDTLTFDKAFNNPVADSFIVKAAEDSVLAGQGMKLTVTAIDSKLTRQAAATRSAVTYGKNGVLVRAVASDVSGITFWGSGVTDNGNGTANLNAANWVLGARSIWVKSTKTLDAFSVAVEDTSTTVVDGNATKVVNFKGGQEKLTVDAADMRKYHVMAMAGGAAVTGVSGPFQVKVTPTDWWGNASTKKQSATTPASADSLALLDTRLTGGNSAKVLEEIFVEFGANYGAAQVPSGAQSVMAGGSTFSVVAPNGTGSDLTISVRTINVSGDTSTLTASKHLQSTGSVTVAFVPIGTPIETPGIGAPAAPKNLVVQDYKGADGSGDQGFYVMVSFPHSADHGRVDDYRVWRELDVTTGIDTSGAVVTLTTPVKKWISWTTLDAVPSVEDIARAVVPVTDNKATRWAVTAEDGNDASAAVVAGKKVFTQESVQQMAQFFGVEPNRVVNPEMLGEMFMPSADYVKSIIGDQKNVVFGALDPDVASLVASGTVPTSIRTSGATVTSSAQTVADGAVAAMDNIAPTAVTAAEAKSSTNVSWTASVDDKTVGYVNYRGFAIAIAGVTKYEIYGGSSQDALALIGSVPAGAGSFQAETLPGFLRVDALDLDNRTMGSVFQGPTGRVWLEGPGGKTLYIVAGANSSTPNKVDFEDFIAFAQAFNARTGEANFNVGADTNEDGVINFPDFIAFAGVFGLEAVGAPATKPVIGVPGVNENAEFSLRMGSDRVMVGETVSVDVSLANVQALMGYQFALNYDTDKFEFVGAAPAEQDLLTSTGGETPLFHSWSDNAGEVTVANAVINGSAINGGGDIVRLTFKVLREFEDNARFEVANGLIADPSQLSNPAVVAGVLDIQSTPTEFSLLQNFPNPFNPETTIQYNLAESADVTLHIYNVVGQVVRTLVAERQSAGRYRVQWSGMDDRSVPVSSGIYFYEIRAGKNKDVRKLMLLK